ncbi:MAG: SUMF1/EgtB/PvdO family nonheme iron enzyme [Treponema sp.]|jgi:formylglycine-generating enzyme required for sulfatase activity|nr:SUMF1/EgtB/PvdO family nonheme iron enzyme [Treponema sp.]
MRKLFAGLLLFITVSVYSQQKFALVIGNQDYTGVSKLNNPVNDANDMEAALRGLGFTVDKVLDGNRVQMEGTVTRFKNRLSASKNTYGFFYYAGHGVQSEGINYLLPINADIPSESYLPDRAVSVQTIMRELNTAGNELNVIVLDACRNNPYSWARSGSRGLSVISAPVGTIVVYATSANSVAEDGRGRNGLFTTQLLKNLRTPGLTVQEMFNRTGQDVLDASNGNQHPEISLRYFGSAYLGARPAPVAPLAPAAQPTPAPAAQPVPVSQPAAQTTQPAARPAEGFVRINGGTFTMGSPASEPGRHPDEGTQRRITVSSFYMSRYQVTQKEYEEVMGTNPSNWKGPNLPVERVSWFDAVEYCNRRSQREGLYPVYTINGSGDNRAVTWNRSANGYRLPTEAEWEYACRAGTISAYNTGAAISDNIGWYLSNSGSKTHEVGKKPPNAWGLYDMHGNVWELCWDWYGAYPNGARTDPIGASSGTNRVGRGGGWSDSATEVRSACRSGNAPSRQRNNVGFRIVRP